MPGKNGQNGNGVQNNSKTKLNHSERMQKFRATKLKKKQTFRVPNSGKFEHLRKFVASYKQNEAAYNKIMNRKLAQELAQKNNEPKTKTEIKNENNVVIEEPKTQEELQKSADEVAKRNDAETMNLEDIEVDDSDLDDPALDDALEKLEQEIKKEEELKARGIDPASVEELDDPEFAEEARELMKETDEKLEGDALEEAFQNLSNEVEGEVKDPDADENDDPQLDEEMKRLEEEIKKEEGKYEEIKFAEQPEPIAEEDAPIKTKEENMTEVSDSENITPTEFTSIYNQADRSVGDPQLTASVKGQMRGILANSGVDRAKVNETVDKIFHNCLFDRDDGIAAYYNHLKADMSASGKSRSISSIMDMMIKGVGNNLRAPLNRSISDPADRMVAHQKLQDVLLKNYSPAAFSKGIDGKYLNDYYLGDRNNLESYYRTYINKNASEADVDGFEKSVAEARERIENSNIVVEAPEVEELPKVEEPPKVEELPNVEEQPKDEVQPQVDVQPQVALLGIDDYTVTTVGENITPAEFASIYNRADKSVGNSHSTEFAKRQIRETLASSGVDNTKIDETVDKVFNMTLFDKDDGIAAYYNHLKADMSASGKPRSSSSIMEMMIRGAGNNIRLALNGIFSDPVEQMIVHQRLLNVFLQNYSPAAFSNGIDEKYLNNNYYLDDSKNLEAYYRTYINKNASEEDVEDFAKSVSELRVKQEEAYRLMAEEENQMREDLQWEQIQEHVKKLEEMETFSFDESDPLSYESAYKNDVVSDNPQPEPLYSVSELIEMRIAHPDIYEEVNSQLNDILKSAGSVLADKPHYVGVIHDVMSKTMLSAFDADQESVDMADVAAAFFKNAYEGIHGEDWSLKDKVINAQRIADLMLKNYSPIPIVGGEIQRFADNYVLKNKEMYRTLQIAGYDEIDSLFEDVQKELAGVPEMNEQAPVNNEQENEPLSFDESDPLNDESASVGEQIENKENVAIQFDEITEIKVEEHKGPTLADDFEMMRNNSTEPEVIKIVEDEPEVRNPENIEEKQVNAEPAKFDTHAFFQQIENNVLNPRKENNVIVESQPKAEPKPVYSVPPIPGMNSNVKQENKNDAPVLSKEEREAKELADAKAMLETLKNNRTGTIEERRDRAKMIDHYQGIVNKHKSLDELFKESLELAEKARREAQEREEREKQLKELENTGKNDIIEDEKNRSPVEKENPFKHDVVEQNQNRPDNNNAPDFEKENKGVDLLKELNDSNVILEAEEDEETEVLMDDVDKARDIYRPIANEETEAPVDDGDEARDIYRPIANEETEALMDDVDEARDIYPPIANEETEFTRWLNGRIESTAVFDSVYSELSDILQNAGFTDQNELAELVRFTQYYGSRTVRDLPHLDGDNPNMHDIAVQFFEDSYQMIEKAELTPKDRVIAAQKISDVLLKNYSPAASKHEEFGAYADNYVLKNGTLLKEQLEKLNVQDIDTLINDRDIAKASGPESRIPDMVNGAELRENPRDFMLDRSRNEKAITNIRNILVDAGIAEDAAQSLDVGDILENAYSEKNIPTASISMRDVAKHVFVSTYGALTKQELDPNNKIETVQKIADVILKNYSPIIRNKKLDKYANNYVINDRDLLKVSLTELNILENEIKAIVGEDEEKNVENIEQKPLENVNQQNENVDNPQKAQPINDESRVAVYTEKLKAYNNMYKLDIGSDYFASSVTDAWELMTSGDKQKLAEGQKVMSTLIKDTLKKAFDTEKGVAYDEHRLPEYTEIIKSTNELMRSAMYGFTDMYHHPNRKDLFDATAFGGLDAKDMADLTAGDSLWSKDQKSDEAWDIQSREAKNIADNWLKEDRPYEKMINEMKVLVESNEKGIVSRKEMIDKLTAAEWLLVNNEKMMVEDPEDPLNPIPNWGNRYWKALTETRETLGIDKHTSMRDLIQGDYAAMTKAVSSPNYNRTQIQLYILDPDVRELSDSMDFQKEQFATLGEHAKLTEKTDEKHFEELALTENRVQISVKILDQRNIMKNEPKNYNNFIIEKTANIELTAPNQGAV